MFSFSFHIAMRAIIDRWAGSDFQKDYINQGPSWVEKMVGSKL